MLKKNTEYLQLTMTKLMHLPVSKNTTKVVSYYPMKKCIFIFGKGADIIHERFMECNPNTRGEIIWLYLKQC